MTDLVKLLNGVLKMDYQAMARMFVYMILIVMVISGTIIMIMIQLNREAYDTTNLNNDRSDFQQCDIKEMRVLVTGGAGFVGHHLLMRLKAMNIYATGIDNFNAYYDIRLKYARSNISRLVTKWDVCNDLRDILRDHNITHVVHLAAQAGVRHSIEAPQMYVRSNVECFVNLLEIMKNTNIPLIYASSSSVYGRNAKVPFSEDDVTLHPASLYAATKLEGELLAHVYWNIYRQRSIGLRFFTVYGPLGRPDMAYYSFTERIINNLPIDVYNNGKMSRDFTYIDDVIDGLVSCLCAEYDYEIVNLGRGEPQPLMSFIRTLETALNKTAKVVFKGMPKGDVLATFADLSKARRMLGYNPKVSLKEGIRRFVNWYVNRGQKLKGL